MITRLALCCLLVVSCAAHRNPARRDTRESAALAAAAEKYWEGVRWGDAKMATAFVEGAQDKQAFREWLEDRSKMEKLVDVRIEQVDLGPAAPEDAINPPPREATVTIHTEGYTLPEQIVTTDTVSQSWYLLPGGWFVRWP